MVAAATYPSFWLNFLWVLLAATMQEHSFRPPIQPTGLEKELPRAASIHQIPPERASDRTGHSLQELKVCVKLGWRLVCLWFLLCCPTFTCCFRLSSAAF